MEKCCWQLYCCWGCCLYGYSLDWSIRKKTNSRGNVGADLSARKRLILSGLAPSRCSISPLSTASPKTIRSTTTTRRRPTARLGVPSPPNIFDPSHASVRFCSPSPLFFPARTFHFKFGAILPGFRAPVSTLRFLAPSSAGGIVIPVTLAKTACSK